MLESIGLMPFALRSSVPCLCALLVSCAAAPALVPKSNPPCPAVAAVPAALEPDAGAVARVLDDFHAAAAASDEDRYFSYLADDAVFLGTDPDERWDKPGFRAYAHPHFAQGKAWVFRATRRSIRFAPDGTTAWFDEDLATERLGAARGSGVLERREGRWLITQYNLALTIPNERFALVRQAVSARRVHVDPSQPAADLTWLAGTWRGAKGDETVEELWSAPEGGTLVGSGRSIVGGKTTFFEFLRIELRDGHLLYVAQPMGGKPTEFRRVVAHGDGDAVFENRAHDWPKRITYRRTPTGIAVRVEGGAGSRVEQYELEPVIAATLR